MSGESRHHGDGSLLSNSPSNQLLSWGKGGQPAGPLTPAFPELPLAQVFPDRDPTP